MLLPFISLKVNVTYQNRCHFSVLLFPLLKQLEKAVSVYMCVCVFMTVCSHDLGSLLMALRVHIIVVFFTKGFEEYVPSQCL